MKIRGVPSFSQKYYDLLQDHTVQTKHHLVGHDPRHPLNTSQINKSLWTSDEKERFFHAISVYSCMRPEEIKIEVGNGKTILEVCEYIDHLERAARDLNNSKEEEEEDDDDDSDDDNDDDTIDAGNRMEEGNLDEDEFECDSGDIAIEVSNDWIRYEEQAALGIIAFEPHKHLEQLENERKAVMATWISQEVGADIIDQEKRLWEFEDKLQSMGMKECRSVDRILKEWEDNEHVRLTQTEMYGFGDGDSNANPDLDALPCALKVDKLEHMMTVDVNMHSPNNASPREDAETDEEMKNIDPNLRPLHLRTAQNVSLSLSNAVAESRNDSETDEDMRNIDPILRPPRSRSIAAQPVASTLRAHADAETKEIEITDDFQTISRDDRRRMLKRLQMRKYRARQAGKEPDLNLHRLKVGRKSAPIQKTYSKDSVARMHHDMKDLGVSQGMLRHHDMYLFHFGAVWRMVKNSNSGRQQLSGHVLKAVGQQLREFAVHLMRRTITVQKLYPIGDRLDTRWKAEMVTRRHVEKAAESMSFPSADASTVGFDMQMNLWKPMIRLPPGRTELKDVRLLDSDTDSNDSEEDLESDADRDTVDQLTEEHARQDLWAAVGASVPKFVEEIELDSSEPATFKSAEFIEDSDEY